MPRRPLAAIQPPVAITPLVDHYRPAAALASIFVLTPAETRIAIDMVGGRFDADPTFTSPPF